MQKMIKEKSKKHTPYGFKISGDVISIDAAASVEEAARLLTKNNIGVVLVKSGNRVVGILSERDITQRVVAKEKSPKITRVREAMTRDIVTVNLEEGLDKVHRVMSRIKFRHLPVRKGNEIIGIVSNRDLMFLRRLKTVR